MGFFIFYITGFVMAFLLIAGLNTAAKHSDMSAGYAVLSWLFIVIIGIISLGQIKPTLKRKKNDNT